METCGVSNVNKNDSNGKRKQKKTVQTPRKHKLSAVVSKTTDQSDLPSTSAKKVKGLKCPRIEIREKYQNRSILPVDLQNVGQPDSCQTLFQEGD